jgi:hypothetical protein
VTWRIFSDNFGLAFGILRLRPERGFGGEPGAIDGQILDQMRPEWQNARAGGAGTLC